MIANRAIARLASLSLSSGAMASAYRAYHGAANGSQNTVTALSRWSVLTKQLPAVDSIKALHVYDFDNTLFKTPLPNPALWAGPTIGLLSTQEAFTNGGWWHDNRILAATGDGVDAEEQRGWEGWWNETIVELVRLSNKQPDALCVLLTGRSEHGFSNLIKKMVKSKELEFDIISLKPRVSPMNQTFQSTMHFKQLFFEALMETYRSATEIRVYEDRPKHTKGFRDFFAEYNRRQVESPTRGPIDADVVQVADSSTTLDPVIEVAEVQHMINQHNAAISKQNPGSSKRKLAIKKTVFFTSYMIGSEDTKKLIKLAQIPPGVPNHELKFHGNNILICPRPCPASIIEKVGGMGSKMLWEVKGVGSFENNIWATSVQPIPHDAKYHTDNPVPLVVLALRKGTRPMDAGKIHQWQPLPANQCFTFETTVGEKVILRVEHDDPKEDEYQSLFANKTSKRKHNGDEDAVSRPTNGQHGSRNESRGYHTSRGSNRGRGGNPGRGRPRGGSRGGRGRGGGHNYRSLDDVDVRGQQGSENDPRAPNSRGNFGRNRPMGGQSSSGSDLQNYY